MRSSVLILALLAACAHARATPYWIAWEGDDWPENQGWTHHASDYFGGPPAVRTLEDGWMTIDGLASIDITDYYTIDRPGQIDPGPGEEFVMQWRLRVDAIQNTPYDPSVVVFSDQAWVVGVEYAVDHIVLQFESSETISFEPFISHSFELRSADMRTYALFVDAQLVRSGLFTHVTYPGRIGWGDSVVGAASQSAWDYFRFGVVPEPMTFVLVLILGGIAGRRSSR
jgi:hypothetical protein